jgi:hypothetical protein
LPIEIQPGHLSPVHVDRHGFDKEARLSLVECTNAQQVFESSLYGQRSAPHSAGGASGAAKVMYFMRRKPHLTLEQFRRWWFDKHVPDNRDRHAPWSAIG